jgi:competence ComEA-like helix-hairpin-helix protein
MNNKRGKVTAFAAIAFVIVFLFIIGVIKENSAVDTLPVIGTVYYGEDYENGITAKAAQSETAKNDSSSADSGKTNAGSTKTELTSEKALQVNINTADKETLMELPGVGEVTADRIIEYREKTPFLSPEDLFNIKGIGEVKLEKILPFITV